MGVPYHCPKTASITKQQYKYNHINLKILIKKLNIEAS